MCQFLIGGNAHRLLSLVVDGRQCPRQCLTCRLESASIISDLPDQLVIIAFKRTRLFVVRIQCHFLVVPKAHQFFTQWIIRTVLILVRHQCDLLAQLFIDADIAQIDAAIACGAPTIELHTGAYADATTAEAQQHELERIVQGAEYAAAKGLVVNAGHGLNLDNVAAIAAIPHIHELNIGHSIIADSVFVGLAQAVKEMKAAIQAAAR